MREDINSELHFRMKLISHFTEVFFVIFCYLFVYVW